MESLISYEGFSDHAFDNDNDEDIELDDWTPPDNELVQKMISQIEHYLSDENLSKDAFLLKHVRRNKMGYVNIKLLTSFKKMKNLTKDWRTTAYALRRSLTLELNAEGNKVRRKNPVPESLLVQVPSRLLLVWNISPSADGPWKSSMESAVAMLGPFGTICTIRIVRPRRELPLEIRKYGYKYPELCSQESVLVEYEDMEGAGRAYHTLSQSGGLARVVLVGRGSRKKAGPEADCQEDRNGGKGVAIVNRRMERLQFRGDDSSPCSSSESEFAGSSPLHASRFCPGPLYGGVLLGQSPKSSPRSAPRVLHAPPSGPRMSSLLASEMWRSPETSPEPDRRCLGDPPDGSPWVQRRRLAAARASSLEDGHAPGPLGPKRASNGDSLPLGVVRYPLGPDGSRGFHSTPGRGRAQHVLKI
ncbi:hypothetical protein AAFF_G00071980 [Aldrovandia affinis]|uniref:La-related protein 6 n=1 Tax=Aldrovandia affinis TaxID=143900 RepID=A0AAD7WE81_9TELE|nr:hypothetical protein AAFF_G00071980 [Aldrovandia affinis]